MCRTYNTPATRALAVASERKTSYSDAGRTCTPATLLHARDPNSAKTLMELGCCKTEQKEGCDLCERQSEVSPQRRVEGEKKNLQVLCSHCLCSACAGMGQLCPSLVFRGREADMSGVLG